MTFVERLRVHRAAAFILGGIGLIVAGLWAIAAAVFGVAVGVGVGLVLAGLAMLIVEALGEDEP